MANIHYFTFTIAILALASSVAYASDPDPLQDFCVALDESKAGFVNGNFCKNPLLVTADDFFYDGLRNAGNTSTPVGSVVTPAFVANLPGINTLGISVSRIDFAPNGLNAPHSHPRASEVLTCLEGTLYAGFISTNPQHRLFAKILHEGDLFVFPRGLIHFQLNLGKTKARAMASFGSQNPGIITIASTMFGSNPPVPTEVLAKAFQVEKWVIDHIEKQFQPENIYDEL
ncbi:hypothetical protein LguiA_013130 [Lonicera macranthoides]